MPLAGCEGSAASQCSHMTAAFCVLAHLPVLADDVAVVAHNHRSVPHDIAMRCIPLQNGADNDLHIAKLWFKMTPAMVGFRRQSSQCLEHSQGEWVLSTPPCCASWQAAESAQPIGQSLRTLQTRTTPAPACRMQTAASRTSEGPETPDHHVES